MEKTTKNWLLAGLGLAAAVGAYMYFKPKKEEGAEETSGFWGVKKPRTMPRGVSPTFRNTNIPCNSGDINEGTWHVSGSTKICVPKSSSRLTPGTRCSTAVRGDAPNNYGTVDYAGRCNPTRS